MMEGSRNYEDHGPEGMKLALRPFQIGGLEIFQNAHDAPMF